MLIIDGGEGALFWNWFLLPLPPPLLCSGSHASLRRLRPPRGRHQVWPPPPPPSSICTPPYAPLPPPHPPSRLRRCPLLRPLCPEWTALISALPPSSPPSLPFHAPRRSCPDTVTPRPPLSVCPPSQPCRWCLRPPPLPQAGHPSIPARNAALHMYATCGRMPDARRLFLEMPQPPTVVAWTALLAGALRWEGLSSGQEIFDKMPHKNEVSWTVMVSACIESGLPKEALSLLAQMLFSGDDYYLAIRNLNHITLCSLLSACSQAGDLRVGRWIHAHFTKAGGILDGKDNDLVKVATALVDMYSKSGKVDLAHRAFEMMPRKLL
ncbi:unnamed protein product [Musa acuminata subsp. burmannicoides]